MPHLEERALFLTQMPKITSSTYVPFIFQTRYIPTGPLKSQHVLPFLAFFKVARSLHLSITSTGTFMDGFFSFANIASLCRGQVSLQRYMEMRTRYKFHTQSFSSCLMTLTGDSAYWTHWWSLRLETVYGTLGSRVQLVIMSLWGLDSKKSQRTSACVQPVTVRGRCQLM